VQSGLSKLPDGGRVIIVGGGPAATACGLALKRLAAQANRNIDVVLVEGKQFAGERHYNQCAGVLSPPLPEILERDLGVPFPHHLTRSKIAGYILHASGQSVTLDDAFEPSTALRRVQFDAYMLDAAVQHGITLVPARAVDIEFHAGNVLVYTENAPLQGDVVVGAFGLDAGSAAMFARVTDYRPPQALSSVVTKYHPGPEGMQAFGAYIHAFLPSDPRIEFGAITPKANHLTINIAGSDADAELMETFLKQPAVRAVLPNLECARQYDGNDLRFFKGYFPCSLANTYYGDRFVMVGDAAGLVRAFKGKGVTSAVQTGIRAAHTILEAGISRQAFDRHFRPANEDILRDLPYGHGMRTLSMLMSRLGLFSPVLRAARKDPHLRTALFDAVSAHAPYSEVLAETLHPASITAVLRAMIPFMDGDQ
jgi:flavin-dependent dehydrogenase